MLFNMGSHHVSTPGNISYTVCHAHTHALCFGICKHECTCNSSGWLICRVSLIGDVYTFTVYLRAGRYLPSLLEELRYDTCCIAVQVICTTSILLPPTDYLTLAEHVEEPTAVSGKYVEGFVAWFRKILGVPPPMFSDQGQIQIMVLNRTENLISSNIGGLAEHFRTKLSHARIWSGDVSELTLSKQIRLVQKTSIFVAVHGDAHALMMFLPPQAVVVEIMPYRHHPGSPYHHGHRNFARMCNRSHVLWQNTQAAWSPDEAKLSDISLSDPTISKIADLSIDMLERNLKDWKQREVLA